MQCKMCQITLLANWSASMCSDCAEAYSKEFKGTMLFSITKESRIRCGYCPLDASTFKNFCNFGKHYYVYHLRAASGKIDSKELETPGSQ